MLCDKFVIVFEQLNDIKTRRFHAILLPDFIEFSKCTGTYSSAKFEYIIVGFLGQRANRTLPRRIETLSNCFETKLFNISTVREINWNLPFKLLAIQKFSIIVFSICSLNFANRAYSKIVPLTLVVSIALVINENISFVQLIFIPGGIMV